jgi:hypothetical protein
LTPQETRPIPSLPPRRRHRLVPRSRNRRKTLRLAHTRAFVNRIFGTDLHAMRVLSLANGVAGVLNAAVVGIHAIGQAYARLAGITPKAGSNRWTVTRPRMT